MPGAVAQLVSPLYMPLGTVDGGSGVAKGRRSALGGTMGYAVGCKTAKTVLK